MIKEREITIGDLVGINNYDYSHEDVRYCYHTVVYLGTKNQAVIRDYERRLSVVNIKDLYLIN